MNILLAYQNNLCRSFLQNTLSEREQLFSISVAGSVEEIKKIVSDEVYNKYTKFKMNKLVMTNK